MVEFDDEIKEASMGFGIKQQLEEADVKDYYNLPSIEEFTKIVKELCKKRLQWEIKKVIKK